MQRVQTQTQAAGPEHYPKYLKLAKSFERQLRMGTLRVGDRLPSIRQLREQHSISAGTVIECYLWLEREGYIRAHPKSGFYVTRTPVSCPEPDVAAPASRPVAVVGTAAPKYQRPRYCFRATGTGSRQPVSSTFSSTEPIDATCAFRV
jgi:DNA-binding transcriptional regulator YhcF (GntR family)